MKYGNLTLGQIEAGINKIGGEEAFMRLLRDELVISAVVKKLFERLSIVIALPVVMQFIAAEKFRPGETIDGIKVSWLNDNFKEHFLPKVESEVAAEELVVNKLLKSSRDPAIITALGGEEKVEVTLGQFWEFLKKTADQNLWYVAYIRDTDGVLWAVDASWCSNELDSNELDVGATSLGRPGGWGADYRFLSR